MQRPLIVQFNTAPQDESVQLSKASWDQGDCDYQFSSDWFSKAERPVPNWHKVALVLRALRGRDMGSIIVWADSDTLRLAHALDFEQALGGRLLGMNYDACTGFNSGVMLMRNDARLLQMFEWVWKNGKKMIYTGLARGFEDQGAICFAARAHKISVQELPDTWNMLAYDLEKTMQDKPLVAAWHGIKNKSLIAASMREVLRGCAVNA